MDSDSNTPCEHQDIIYLSLVSGGTTQFCVSCLTTAKPNVFKTKEDALKMRNIVLKNRKEKRYKGDLNDYQQPF